jgi:hypothetical protein
MNSLTLKILPTVYILYALLKFLEFFFRDEEAKMKGLYTVYVKGGGAVVKVFDNRNAGLHARPSRFAVLGRGGVREFHHGVASRHDHHSGLLPSFFRALATGKSPEPPITALKMLSYSIQANPQRAWRELVLMTILFL